jgi:hypothetical protein
VLISQSRIPATEIFTRLEEEFTNNGIKRLTQSADECFQVATAGNART